MENAIVAIVSTVLIILSSVIMMMSTLQSTAKLSSAWQAMNTAYNATRNTAISAKADGDYNGGPINLIVANDGQSNLCNFSQWDVIAQYQDGPATYLTYVPGTVAGDNEWAVAGIYTTAGQPEIFDPGILNPDEYLEMQISLNPELTPDQSARVTIATPGGVTAQCLVTPKKPV